MRRGNSHYRQNVIIKIMWKRKDFFPSGSAETSPMLLIPGMIGAARYIDERAVLVMKKGMGSTFAGKKGLTEAKNYWLNAASSKVKKEYNGWLLKWNKFDNELYLLATIKNQNWRLGWKRLDELNDRLWLESYKVETLDNFSGEIDAIIQAAFKKFNIPVNEKFRMISPARENLIQEMFADRRKVKANKLSKNNYIRQYWYSQANWNGGEVLDKEILERDLRGKTKTADSKHILGVHKKYDKLLNKKTRSLVEFLRILSLWREERKAVMQKITLGYANISNLVAKELKISPKNVKSTLLHEINSINQNNKAISKRLVESIFLIERNKRNPKVLIGREAKSYIKEFSIESKKQSVGGISASPGLASGRVRIVLRRSDFPKFRKGEILVTTMTRPDFFSILHKARAIVTEEGGLTSHAAIIARELGIPCVIGTKVATKVFRNGDLVEVDARKGIVKVIN